MNNLSALDWLTFATCSILLILLANMSKHFFSKRNFDLAVLCLALLIFLGRFMVLRWYSSVTPTPLLFNFTENSWLIPFLLGDEFTAFSVLFLFESILNILVDWTAIKHSIKNYFEHKKEKRKI